MNLQELYLLRTNFTVIGLTGRTGSGCSRIADILSNSFSNLETQGLRTPEEIDDPVFKRKYLICKTFLSHQNNWVNFEKIRYVDVLIFFILNKYGGDYNNISKLLLTCYKEESAENNRASVEKVLEKINNIDHKYNSLIQKIKNITDFKILKSDEELRNLGEIFFGNEFTELKEQLFEALEQDGGYYKTRLLLHWASCNIRSKGNPIGEGDHDIKNIFTIANIINRLIKAKKVINGTNPTKIVIDSLRNSLEIMFFKERYSAFYMVASKDVIGNSKNRLHERLREKFSDETQRTEIINKILDLDEIEYRTKDFAKGKFSSPDVENCIQKSDYHIFNLKKDGIKSFTDGYFDGNINFFLTREEQIMKLISLIHQPGLITPSSAERAMQIANTAKLNSGCISRKVGAVITDIKFYVKSIGWNDVAKGHTPCNLRSITDFFLSDTEFNNIQDYSPFEKGQASETSSYKYKESKPNNFKDALIEYFKDFYDANKHDLNGKNCSFCFKTVHNHFEGEANQVHTRSLHAEENAMLQITKLGGMGSEGGILFTTASPCELCAKKAYQLGIKKIYFIDPYPGISVDQIIKGGNKDTQPKLIPFYGAIGNAYHELYDSFLSYKDEISMTLEINQKQKISKEINNVLSKIGDSEINNFLEESNLNDQEVIKIIKSAITNYKKNKTDTI